MGVSWREAAVTAVNVPYEWTEVPMEDGPPDSEGGL
jgi:hypothetical protein